MTAFKPVTITKQEIKQAYIDLLRYYETQEQTKNIKIITQVLKEILNNTGIIREYKNGNITIKIFSDGMPDFERDNILETSELLSLIDCDFIGETYCLSNWETGHTIYNCYSDLVYIFPWSFLDDLKQGKTVRLYARQPDETDREIIESEF